MSRTCARYDCRYPNCNCYPENIEGWQINTEGWQISWPPERIPVTTTTWIDMKDDKPIKLTVDEVNKLKEAMMVSPSIKELIIEKVLPYVEVEVDEDFFDV